MKVHNFKELNVWKKSIDLAVLCYSLTSGFPKEEKFGLISQIQRAGVSIPSNIAEGSGRVSSKEFQHFVAISMGSSFEVETQMILANKFDYISKEQLATFTLAVSEVQRMLFGFYNSLN